MANATQLNCKMYDFNIDSHRSVSPARRTKLSLGWLAVLLLLIGLLGSQLSETRSGQVDEQAGVGKCAARASCKQRGRRLELDAGSDKRACYCDLNCIQYDDCCADLPKAANLSARIELGIDRIRSARSLWQCRRMGIFGDVLLKSSCAPSWPTVANSSQDSEAIQVRIKCEQTGHTLRSPNSQLDPLGWLLPITDLKSGITYANSHCLRCNRPALDAPKLVYWSPMLECNYKPDSDDRNTLYDLLLSNHGKALEYSTKLARWVLKVPQHDLPMLKNQTERVCSVAPSVPDSAEHMIRFCRMNTIDRCTNFPDKPSDLDLKDREECEFGHQALVYSQTSDAIYRNIACARCNRERQVFCEPRTRKRLPVGAVNRVVVYQAYSPQQPNGERILFAPASPISDEPELPGDVSRTAHSSGASFSVLLDLYGPGVGDEQIGAIHQCQDHQGQVYDPFFLTCRDVVCGLNQRYDSQLATCVRNVTSVAEAPKSTPASTTLEPATMTTRESRNTYEKSTSTSRPSLVGSNKLVSDTLRQSASDLSNWNPDADNDDSARRKFIECGKILIPPEHYRLFTSVVDRAATNQSQTSSGRLRSGATQPAESNKLWAYVEPYQLTLASSQFELVRSLRPQQVDSELDGGSGNHRQQALITTAVNDSQTTEFALLICTPFAGDLVAKFKPAMAYVTSILLCVSVASLALYLLLYVLSLLDLRSLSLELARVELRQENLKASGLSPLAQPRGSKDSAGLGSLAGVQQSSNTVGRGQSLSSRGVACLAGSLLTAYLLFLVGAHRQQSDSTDRKSPSPSCVWLAIATYYCFLVAFSWMFLLAYDIWRTLRLATRELRGPAQHTQSKRFISYALSALLVSGAIVALAILADTQPNCSTSDTNSRLIWHQQLKPGFGEHIGACWFSNRRALALFFGLPVALVVLVNFAFFLHSSSMVLQSSTRSGRRHYSTSSGSSAQPAIRIRQVNTTNECEECRGIDYAHQNGLTTQSLASVQTLQSQLSFAATSSPNGSVSSRESECESTGEESPVPSPGGVCSHHPLAGAVIGQAKHLAKARKLTASSSFGSFKQHSMALEARFAGNLSSIVGSIAKDYRLYCRLSTITGITWLVGLLASLVDHSDLLWYLFVVLNTLQGLFIFIAFGCKRSKLANLQLLLSYLRMRCCIGRQ